MISVPFSDVSVAGFVGSGFDDCSGCMVSVPLSDVSVAGIVGSGFDDGSGYMVAVPLSDGFGCRFSLAVVLMIGFDACFQCLFPPKVYYGGTFM